MQGKLLKTMSADTEKAALSEAELEGDYARIMRAQTPSATPARASASTQRRRRAQPTRR